MSLYKHGLFGKLYTTVLIYFATYVQLLYKCIANCAQISEFIKPNPLPKCFAVDVDETFYIEDTDMMKKNIDAFKKLKTKNISPFFCTGRHYLCNKKLLGQQFFTDTDYNGYPGIYLNGALVYDENGKVLHIEKFTEDFLNKFKDYAKNNQIEDKVLYYTDEGVYCVGKFDSEGIQLLRTIKMLEPEEKTENDLKDKNIVSLVFPGQNVNITGLNKGTDYQVKYPNTRVAFVTPGNCTKKKALEVLLKYLKADEKECVYIGDSDNDIEAMEFCKLSFAVNNATNEVKQKAKWVVDLNYDQGAFEKVVDLLCKDQTIATN